MSEPKTRRVPKLIWFAAAAVVIMVFLLVCVPWYREQVAIRMVENVGGSVYLSNELHTVSDRPLWVSNSPEWIQELYEGGWLFLFERVKKVRLGKTWISDERLKHLSHLTRLENLDLDSTLVGDEGLKYLYGLTNLEYLNLAKTQVTEAGVRELQTALPKCEIEY